MQRFLPDGWLEGLLRPFILIDPSSYVYFEEAAPDWRFAALFILLAVAVLAGRVPQRLQAGQGRLLLGLLLLLYAWTFTTGNGRYFVAGLLLVGPALVLAIRLMPGTRTFRALTLLGVLALQGITIAQVYRPSHWGLVHWRSGPGLPIEESPLRQQPAVFLSVGTLSFSLLVPRFHPDSRWANIEGQRSITPAMEEYPRLLSMLDSGLPIYVVVPENVNLMTPELQPNAQMHNLLARVLARYKLALTGQPCVTLQSVLKPQGLSKDVEIHRPQGFWFCAAGHSDAAPPPDAQWAGAPADLEAIFAAVERRCPRFFRTGDGNTGHYDGYSMRHYQGSDMRLYVEDKGRVLYKYFRALNPTSIGTLDQVRRGEFELNCDKLSGRYRLPWQDD